ncbi:hypothetical protein CSW37_05455 [Thermus scotoductus]|jgi:hypothetical protein|uniref:Uncharacterized protein n=7 Tax=Thermus scotoductus TaxID=37636 RepID=A0A430RM87_THESC|nr:MULTISPECIES: hypothetical protein [Thermus]RTG93542.1 hypothetical protein CSW48_10830 [Thermus scotoductus]RTG96329.1 hypothetical protein CSW49_05200 [Thermus scotoductus]RTG98299.1 hypothetical protein CSW51_01960 [Thermus scotoductus]RTH04824.1 hypothetical protein CSW45_04455 [Thermus scotoductus]RTH10545.1 hypothetical protein CSW43_08515 [Thermus scotoductus]
MRLRLAAFLFILPFFLQLLGFGKTPLGGGLCGELFLVQNPALAFQTPGFWYALLFMVLLALELGYGLSLLLLPLLEVSIGPGWRRLGRYLVGVMGGLFLLTRTTGLPAPGPGGWVLERAPVDPLSLLLVGLSLAGGFLLRENGGHGAAS